MKTFKFEEKKIEAELQLIDGSMIKLFALYPTPTEVNRYVQRENNGGVEDIAKTLSEIFNVEESIFLSRIKVNQLHAVYNWYWGEVKEGAKTIPPAGAGK